MTWLLVAANNYLRQQRPDRAIILLEFLGLVDPVNLQGRKMLAYAYWQRGDGPRCSAVIESLLQQPLSDEDRDALKLMKLRLRVAVSRAKAAKQRPRPA